MIGVDVTRGQIHRAAAVGAGDEDLRHGSLYTVFVHAEHGAVLPAQTLIEDDFHALSGHLSGLHTFRVGQTIDGNAQGLEGAGIGGLVYLNILAVIVAGNVQHLAIGRGVGVVAADRCIVDAQHIGVQGKLCAALAHQIDGLGRNVQASAVYCRNIAVAHRQLAELLPGCQHILNSLNAVGQFAQNGIRNGKLAVIRGAEIAVQNNCIGNGAFALAEQGVKDTAGDLDPAAI